MARMARVELFAPDEIAVVHVVSRVVRQTFLMGTDNKSGKNYDYRKTWIESQLERLAGLFGIDLLTFAILSNHYHLVLRSRPDVVQQWSDQEVARRWMLLCPNRKHADGTAKEPNQAELNSIATDPEKLTEIRSRLSDISWWMRLINQRIAQRANFEDEASGAFWQSRFHAVRLIDEEAILACSAYVDLNAIRAAVAGTLEDSEFTSVQRRIQSLLFDKSVDHTVDEESSSNLADAKSESRQGPIGEKSKTIGGQARKPPPSPDAFLSPVSIDELRDALGPQVHKSGTRCSDKGFLPMSSTAYLELLDWTARQLTAGKRGSTPLEAPPILERLKLRPAVWLMLATEFGRLFSLIAGQPYHIDDHRGRQRNTRFHIPSATRELLSA